MVPRRTEKKVKVAVAVLAVPDGPEGSRVVSGTVVSTITVRALDTAEELPEAPAVVVHMEFDSWKSPTVLFASAVPETAKTPSLS